MALFYPRHFLLLACFSSAGVMSRLHLFGNLSVAFAVYGALHAVALVARLCGRPGPLWRKCLFIAVCRGSLRHDPSCRNRCSGSSGGLPGNVGLYAALGFSALIGAVAYGILIRLFGIYAVDR